MLFGFGLIGAILMSPLYIMMVILFFKLARLLKLVIINYLSDPLTLVFSIYIILMIAGKFTYRVWNISVDFTGERMSETAIILGLGFALYFKIHLNTYNSKINSFTTLKNKTSRSR